MVVDVFEVVVDIFEVAVGGCRWLQIFYEVVVGGFRSFHVLVTTITGHTLNLIARTCPIMHNIHLAF